MKTYERSKTALAAALKVSRTTVQRYLSMPDAPRQGPRGWNVAECQKFIGGQKTTIDPSTANLREQKIGEEVRKLRIANDRNSGVLVDRARVMQFWGHYAGGLQTVLAQKLENELPVAVAGLQPADARVICKRIRDQLLQELQQVVKDFDVKFPPPSNCETRIT